MSQEIDSCSGRGGGRTRDCAEADVTLFVGRVEVVRETGGERWGVVSLRGARTEVGLDCVPQALPGDSVLVIAGVAIAQVAGDADEAAGPSA
jgi:hydrogenase maturation factor